MKKQSKQQGSLLIKVFGILIIGAIVLSSYYLYLAKTKLQKEKLPKPVPIETLVKQMEKDGVLLKLDRTDTLAGIDADNNGIRDDIDEYIRQTFKDEAQRKAVEQLARSIQAEILTDKNDIATVFEVNKKSSRAISCLGDRFITGSRATNDLDFKEFDEVSKEIEMRSANTKQRLNAYFAFSEALSGQILTSPKKGEGCDE